MGKDEKLGIAIKYAPDEYVDDFFAKKSRVRISKGRVP
jgi:hypothetical protein